MRCEGCHGAHTNIANACFAEGLENLPSLPANEGETRRNTLCSRNRLLVIAAVALFNCLGITYLDLPKYFSLVVWRGGRVLVSYRLAKESYCGICS